MGSIAMGCVLPRVCDLRPECFPVLLRPGRVKHQANTAMMYSPETARAPLICGVSCDWRLVRERHASKARQSTLAQLQPF